MSPALAGRFITTSTTWEAPYLLLNVICIVRGLCLDSLIIVGLNFIPSCLSLLYPACCLLYTFQFSSVTQSCPTLYDPINCSIPGLPVHHQLPEFTQTHVHRVGDAIQPSHSVVPFSSCPQFLPASESFPMSQLFTWGGQSTGVSALASFLPKNTQDWTPFEWTGWISLQSKTLSRVFSNTTVQKHQFFST